MVDELDSNSPGQDGSNPTAPIHIPAHRVRQSPVESATQELPTDSPAAPALPSGARLFWTAVDRGPQGKPWRVLTIVLLVIGCVIAPLGVTAAWAKNLVYNQDTYLAAVQPLVTDPVIVSAAEKAIIAGVDNAISNVNIADSIGSELQSLGLPPKLATLATGYLATFREDIVNAVTKMVDDLVESPQVITIWDKANAAAHTKFVQVMQGQDGELHTLSVDLSSAVAQVKQKLTSSGVQWASQIPDIPVVFNIAGNADVQMVAGYYDLLGTLGTWLPIIAVILLLVSILIAPSRLGGLSKAAGWLAVSMVALALALVAGREWLISKSSLQPQVTSAFTRQLTLDLQATIKFILIVGAVVAALTWMFGRSSSAVGLRHEVGGAVNRVQDSRWFLAIRVAGAVLALALVLVLLSLDMTSLWLALLLAVLAGLFAVVAISPRRHPDPGALPEPGALPDDGAAADRVVVSS
ncbi:MAG: hypothetical protein ABJD68_15495 [Nakamurella sp.]